MIEQFKDLIFVKSLKDINSFFTNNLKVKNYPYISYLGVNFLDKEIVSLKLYYIVSKKVKKNTINEIFPLTELLENRYEEYIERTSLDLDNMGIGFAIKINKTKNLFYTYYQDTSKHHSPFIPNINLSLPCEDISMRENYFVYELKNNGGYCKNYKLFVNKDNVRFLLDYFSLHELHERDYKSVEYSEFNNSAKINLYPNNQSVLNNLLNTYSAKQMELINFICNKYNVCTGFPGFYHKDRIKSIYFFNNNVERNFFSNGDLLGKIYY